MTNLLQALETKCNNILNETNPSNTKLFEILKGIEFQEGGTIHIENHDDIAEVIVLSGDNGRHHFGNFKNESCFESSILTLLS